jgi:hypothetical protein
VKVQTQCVLSDSFIILVIMDTHGDDWTKRFSVMLHSTVPDMPIHDVEELVTVSSLVTGCHYRVVLLLLLILQLVTMVGIKPGTLRLQKFTRTLNYRGRRKSASSIWLSLLKDTK